MLIEGVSLEPFTALQCQGQKPNDDRERRGRNWSNGEGFYF